MIEIQPPLPSDTGEAAVSRNALWGDAFSEHGVIGKIFVNSFSFQATEIVFTSKWGRIQPEIQICLHEDSSCLRAARALRATLNHSGLEEVSKCLQTI